MGFCRKKGNRRVNQKRNRSMNKPVRVILLDEADIEYKKLNEIVGQQTSDGKENTFEM